MRRIDLSKLDLLRNGELANEIGYVIETLIGEEGVPLSRQEKERLVIEVQHETFGLGPIEPLLSSPDISDILVNNYNSTYVERHGKLEKTDIVFRDNNHLMQIIERIVTKVGRRIDESSPYVDARLPDGSRVNAIIPPLGHRWTGSLDPPFRSGRAQDDRHAGTGVIRSAHCHNHRRGGEIPSQYPDLRRDRDG